MVWQYKHSQHMTPLAILAMIRIPEAMAIQGAMFGYRHVCLIGMICLTTSIYAIVR